MTSSAQIIKQSPKAKVLKTNKTSSDANLEAVASIEKDENSDKPEQVSINTNAKATYTKHKKTSKNLKKVLFYAIKSDLDSELLYMLNHKFQEAKELRKNLKREWQESRKLLKVLSKKA